MANARVLISWIGISDLRAEVLQSGSEGAKGKNDPGPVLRLLRAERFDRIYLLNDVPLDASADQRMSPRQYFEWLKQQLHTLYGTSAPLMTELSSSDNFRNDYEGAYNFTKQKIEEIVAKVRGEHEQARFACLLTPGYPPCQISMLLASEGIFRSQVELFNTLDPRDARNPQAPDSDFVERVEFPFSLRVDMCLPAMYRQLLASSAPIRREFASIIGESKAIQAAKRRAQLAAPFDIEILLAGPSGSGKELFAKAIHDSSRRSNRPFLAVNCGAIAESLLESELFGHVKGAFSGAVESRVGYIEQASQGTLFLDEIHLLSRAAQGTLLRVLAEKKIVPVGGDAAHPRDVDFRLICGTNENLLRLVASRMFREDLYYRIAGYPLSLPPLRERGDDVRLLAEHFLQAFNRLHKFELAFDDQALASLASRRWPGNVRELQKAVEAIAILASDQQVISREYVEAALRPESRVEVSSLRELSPIEFGHELVAVLDELLDRFQDHAARLPWNFADEKPKLLEELLRPLLAGRSLRMSNGTASTAARMWLGEKVKGFGDWWKDGEEQRYNKLERAIDEVTVARRRGKME